MDDKKKNFGYGLSITLGTIVIGLISYIFYSTSILPSQEPPRCEYGGWAYADKEVFDSSDGCNTCFCHTGEIVCSERECDSPESSIGITTDKNTYQRGENVEIVVTNSSQSTTYYSPYGEFWSIQVFKDDEWIDLNELEEIQLITQEYELEFGKDFGISQTCSLISYEKQSLKELPQSQSLTSQWEQKYCKFTPLSSSNGFVKEIDKGKYRITFSYGEHLSENPYNLTNIQSVFSQPFLVE